MKSFMGRFWSALLCGALSTLACGSAARVHEFIFKPAQLHVEKRIDTNTKEFDILAPKATLVFSVQ